MDGFLQDFANYQRRRNLAAGTIYRRTRTLKQFGRWLAPTSLACATPGDIEAWLAGLDLSPRSAYVYLSTLSNFYRWLGESNPAAKIERPRLPRLLPRPLRSDDIAVALDAAAPRMKVWLCLATFQGLRCQEMAYLRHDDILEGHDPMLIVVSKGKGDHQRILPAHLSTAGALDEYGWRTRPGWLFRTNDGRRFQPGTVSKYIARHLHLCGVDGSAHMGRHWFGSRFYAESRDLRLTQEMMGHADPKTTSIYTAWSPSDAVDVMSRLQLDQAKARHPTSLPRETPAP